MQQETRTITIELVDRTNDRHRRSEEFDTGNGLGSNEHNRVDDQAERELSKRTLFLNYAAKRAWSVLKQATISTANRYWSLTEDYLAQNTFNNTMNVINETIGFGSTLAAGFAIGGAVGSGIAAVGYGAAKAISTVNEYSNLRQTINTTNYNMQFQRTRMGLVDNGRGTEN